MHVQCGATCIAEALGIGTVHAAPVNVEPPCHKHSEVPTKSPQPSHETNNGCDQGSAIEAKVSAAGKHIAPPAAVIELPITTRILFVPRPPTRIADDFPSSVSSPPPAFTILRI
jgi:hypothetical protein